MAKFKIDEVVEILEKNFEKYKTPIVTEIARREDPYKVLISTLISLRTKDEVTAKCSRKLFERAETPQEMVKLKTKEIEEILYPAGFYRNKAKTIIEVSQKLIEEHGGKVPKEVEELTKYKGVGRKTANLVVSLGYGIPAICVDVHVHRISNRFGYVKTKKPEETEYALREILPEKYWIAYNSLLVAYGQNICRPISPHCSKCEIEKYCKKVGVEKSR
ncbi:MAG: endonuclease III [Candidatus Heimdallarchaeota archaeon]|nr:endonuclease III [Candidatus Heimdallarchaeota archaeon]MCK5049537.1 endonuclease III [Candidatus Heimdallarchaeota archaeon]